MQSLFSVRLIRALMIICPAFVLGACGDGEGKPRILNSPVPPVVAPPANCNDAVTFEDACPAVTFTDFEGGVSTIIDNPQQGTENPSAKVVQMQKFGATSGATFGGSTLALPMPLNVTAGSSFTMKVWSQRAVQVLFQPEPQGPGSGIEVTHGGTGWEELTFSLPGLSGSVSGITVILDNGTLGAAATDPNNWTFYFDDITLVPPGTGGGGGTFSAITFDDPNTTYTLTGFGGAEDSSIQADPAGGTNQVVQVNRAAGAEVFAGTTVATEANDAVPTIPLDASNTQMTVRVYSPAAGVPVRLKIEDAADPTISVETEATTTVANTWETLTFDFANEVMGTAAFNPAATYNKVTIFFNFGAAGAPAETYFFDDIDVGSGNTGGGGTFSAITFDDPNTTYTLIGFGGAEDSSVQADPTGGTNQVAQVNRAAGAEVFAGTTVATEAYEAVPTRPRGASNTQMTVRVYSPAAGVPVRLKIEDAADPTISVETEATTTVANAWETLTFDFANQVAGTAAFDPNATYNKVTIFFNFGAAGAPAETYFFDDIDVGSGNTGGGGTFNGLSFDDPNTTYTFTGFGGAEDSSLAVDPTDPNNMVVQVNRAAGAQTFAGTTVSTGANNSVPRIPLDAANTQMSVRVYSPAAGIPVRLKIEDSSDPTVSVEAEVLTTVANTWETLTFNFLNQVAGTAAFDPNATYDKVTIFFNFGAAGAPAETYFFDDILVVPGNGGGGGGATFSTITFDDPNTTYTLIGFGGAEGSFVTNDPAGGTNMVVQVDRAAGAQVFAGTTVATEANDAVPTIPLDAANTQMTVRVFSAAAGIPVRLKIEDASDPTTSVETEATTTVAGAWETLTFNFLNEVSGTSAFDPNATYDKVTIFFNFGAAGAPAETYYFDDIDVLAGNGGGGGGGTFGTITFDDPNTTYTLIGFGGAEDSTVQADPTGGSNMVVQVNRAAGAQVFAGTTVATEPNDAVPTIPLDAANTQMTVRVYSAAAGIPVRLKIEDASDPTTSVETEATTTVAGAWETLTFNFLNEVSGTSAFDPNATYDKVTIFFNFGAAGAPAETYYFDDIDVLAGNGSGGGGMFGAITFDDPNTTYTLTGFGGAEDSTVAADPAGGSNMVGRVVKSNTAQLWAGTTVSTGANESIPAIPLDASNTQMTVRVYSPVVGIPVRLKIEDASDPTITVETEAMTTAVNTWETLTFDFANEAAGTAAFDPNATYNKVSIFFNFGTDGASGGGGTFFFDDIDVGSGSGGGGTSFSGLSFDDPNTTYTFTGFGGAEDSSLAADPTDPNNMVVQVNRAAGAQTFAGTTVSTGANNSVPTIPLDAANTQMSVRVYSPAAGIPVRLKIEDSSDPTVSVEAEVLTTVANTWETLTFNFLNQVAGTAAFDPNATYDKVTIFFNFGAAGAPAETYFFDDILVVAGNGSGGGGGSSFSAITFDDSNLTYTLTDFGGNASTVTNDPAGGTNMVVQVIKSNTAQLWAGTTVSTEANDAIPTIPLDAANTQMTVRVYSPDAGIPVRLKIEDASDPTISVETEAMTTMAGAWETLTFDFANQVAGTAAFDPNATYNKISIFFNFGTDGATAGEKTYYFDDIDVVTGGGGGGGSGYATITFDDPMITYSLIGFGGAEGSTVTNDPAGGSNMVAQVIKSNTAQLWAGTTVATEPNDAIPTLPLDAANAQMTVRVYSPDAGIPVRLKIEDASDPTIAVETEAMTTGVNTWEALTFDFANQVAGTAAFDPNATYNKISIFFNFGTDGATAGEKTYYFDDIDVANGGGGGGSSGNFTNGDFETGDFTGWTLFQDPPGGGSISIDTSGQGGRAGSVARLVATGSDVVGTNDVIIGQVALGAGTISPGDTIDVSFDLFGSLTGAGGVVFVEVIFLDGSGNDNGRDFVGPAAPYTPTNAWTPHSGSVTAGTTVGGGSADVSGGVTLELKAACGAIVGGCGVDASFDNVTFVIN